jgi:hypothetical protein
LDGVLLPMGWEVGPQEICVIYRGYRKIASVLAGVVILGSFVGIIVGGLALGGVVF